MSGGSSEPESAFIGLDIGGQSIKGILLGDSGRVISESSRPTPASEGAGAVLAAIGALVGELGAAAGKFEAKIGAAGVGTPGGVDSRGRIVGEAANIPGWVGTPLGDEVSAMLGCPCAVRNDGNLAAYAEWAVRAGRSRALLFIGLGTGIGGGYVEDGRVLGGCEDRALEIGHIVIEPAGRACVCGIAGCSEAYASGPSIGRIATALAQGDFPAGDSLFGCCAGAGLASSPLAVRARAGEKLNASDVYEAFAAGDSLAIAVDHVVAEALARTSATGIAILAPDLVVLGGGVIRGAPHLVAEMGRRVSRYVYADARKQCRFENAMLSHSAGLLGAALYGASLVMGREQILDFALRALACSPSRLPAGES